MKYIVKNCPAYPIGCQSSNGACSFPDCPIKQIVEVCLRYYPVSLIKTLQEEILQILQVEEVE